MAAKPTRDRPAAAAPPRHYRGRALRIVSDGVLSRIVDAETGREIDGVTACDITFRHGATPTARMEFVAVKADVVAEVGGPDGMFAASCERKTDLLKDVAGRLRDGLALGDAANVRGAVAEVVSLIDAELVLSEVGACSRICK